MFKKRYFQKLAGLWLAGEVVDHVGIYGSKAAEGLSAFQRRSCCQVEIGYIIMVISETSNDFEGTCPSISVLSVLA